MINLDTHILIHALSGTLRPSERKHLSENPWGIAAIVQWEFAKLAQLGRIQIDLDEPVLRRVFRRLHVWPLDMQIALQSTNMDFDSDPADELIAATSVIHEVPLMTRDKVLRQSRITPLI